MSPEYKIPQLPLPIDLETKEVLRQVNRASRKLAELKGVAQTIPNENILISTLTLQEAKDSSEVENIVTTQDDLYKAELNLKNGLIKAADKEVRKYRDALLVGYRQAKEHGLITLNTIKEIQRTLEDNNAGFRAVPGTSLKNGKGEVVYIPPQDHAEIVAYMSNLEQFVNDDSMSDLDPLIKMAIIHHQFESIHPFYDGNGRTGRILLILYMVITKLLDLPILYLSRYITHNKSIYYHLIQNIRNANGSGHKEWEEWILFLLKGVEETAAQTIGLVKDISKLMDEYKKKLKPAFGAQYKQELLNNLFYHPYTKIDYMMDDMHVKTPKTAANYLDRIVEMGLLKKVKMGTSNYYINTELMDLFMRVGSPEEDRTGEKPLFVTDKGGDKGGKLGNSTDKDGDIGHNVPVLTHDRAGKDISKSISKDASVGYMESHYCPSTTLVERLVLAFPDGYAGIKELMAMMNYRSRPSFVKNYISPALADGSIELRYPQSPKHPQQAYRLTEAAKQWKYFGN